MYFNINVRYLTKLYDPIDYLRARVQKGVDCYSSTVPGGLITDDSVCQNALQPSCLLCSSELPGTRTQRR